MSLNDKWLAEQKAKTKADKKINPCVIKFGHGPLKTKCKDCARLTRSGHRNGCRLRKRSTYHKVSFPACAKFLSLLKCPYCGQGIDMTVLTAEWYNQSIKMYELNCPKCDKEIHVTMQGDCQPVLF